MAETIADEWRKARKPHVCIWCGEPIVVGESYRHWRGKFEGEVITNDWHKECDDAASTEDPEDGFEPYFYKRGSQEERDFPVPRATPNPSSEPK